MTPHLIALTGSIGMGKSTTAQMFVAAGVPLWDADVAVHRLYGKGGAAVKPIRKIVPTAIRDEQVDRGVLRTLILEDATLIEQIEAIVHPLVAQDRAEFIATTSSDFLLFDIPLLFETGGAAAFDTVVVVTAPEQVQRARVLARSGMTVETFEMILARQMPDAEKRHRADYCIDTSIGIEAAQAQVREILDAIRGQINA